MIGAIARWFVAPGARRAPAEKRIAAAAQGDVAATVAVVCGSQDGQAIGAAVALVLRRSAGARCALVVGWGCATGSNLGIVLPAAPAARRLAASLAARGLDGAAAMGFLVQLRLPTAEADAVVVARGALAAASGVPAVLVVAGPRTPAIDALLTEQDRVVVVTSDADPELTALALTSLPAGVPAAACRLDVGVAARALAAAGVGLAPALRATLRPAIDAS